MKTREITIGGMLMAIILVMSLVPNFGFIQLGVVSVTLIHIPVLIGSMAFKNTKLALVTGATFGVASWLVAMTRPSAPTDFVFQNPMVSVVPRILFALIACVLYIFLAKKMKKDYSAALISTIVACLFHTISVLLMLFVFAPTDLFPGGFYQLLIGVMLANGWIEIIIAAIIVPVVVVALGKAVRV